MTPRDLADLCERAPGFDAETLRLLADTLRAQADEIYRLKDVVKHAEYWEAVRRDERDSQAAAAASLRAEIDALKAAAIVAGSLKLDEACKVATRREAIKAAWGWISGRGGWLSCVGEHDGRCDYERGVMDNRCTCGADDFRRLMEV